MGLWCPFVDPPFFCFNAQSFLPFFRTILESEKGRGFSRRRYGGPQRFLSKIFSKEFLVSPCLLPPATSWESSLSRISKTAESFGITKEREHTKILSSFAIKKTSFKLNYKHVGSDQKTQKKHFFFIQKSLQLRWEENFKLCHWKNTSLQKSKESCSTAIWTLEPLSNFCRQNFLVIWNISCT